MPPVARSQERSQARPRVRVSLLTRRIGAGSNLAGDFTTRVIMDDPDDQMTATDVATDLVAGLVGGGVGHVAADFIHVPEDPGPRPQNGRRRIAKYNTRMAERNRAIRTGVAVGTAVSVPAAHGTQWGIENAWNEYALRVLDDQQQPPTDPTGSKPDVHSRIIPCGNPPGQPCN